MVLSFLGPALNDIQLQSKAWKEVLVRQNPQRSVQAKIEKARSQKQGKVTITINDRTELRVGGVEAGNDSRSWTSWRYQVRTGLS